MSEYAMNQAMLDMFVIESSQLIEQLENSILSSERRNEYSTDDINEIFRIMHTIKGSSAVMNFSEISALAHAMEDQFFSLRAGNTVGINYSALSDLILEGIDFIKVELHKIKNGYPVFHGEFSVYFNMKSLRAKSCL